MRKKLLIISGVIIIIVFGVLLIFHAAGKNLFLSKQEPEEISISWSEIFNRAAEQEAKGDISRAKSLYEKLVNDFANSPQVGDWQKKIWDLNIKLLFSPMITEESVLYEIEPGDSLAKIAKKFNTTVELLKKSNGLLSDKIISGRKLKTWTRPFNIVVDKSQNILILKSNDEVIKTYIVSTGINNCTPIGNFKVVKKLVDPPWYTDGTVIPPESPDNILGSRWMGFDLEGYGIHGTNNNGTLGQQITQGCIRMSNTDVEELFAIVPRGATVVIVD